MLNAHADSRPPRIAHILPWPAIGGVEVATLRAAEAVRSWGFDSIAFCPGSRSILSDRFASSGFETVPYTRVEPSFRRPLPFLKNSLWLAREFRRQRIDLLHCADLLAGYYVALAARLARIPTICHIRCEYDAISRRDQSFLSLIDRFVFVSEHTRSAFAYRDAARRSTVLYDGLDLPVRSDPESVAEVRSELEIPPDVAIIGMVARVAPIKDYLTLIRAARRVVDVNPAVRFLIVGDHSGAESYRTHYEEVRRALLDEDLANHFVFTGFRKDVHRLVAAMDVALLVTHSEGLPLVLLEAMAAGKPVVATAVGGIPELIEHDRTGLLHSHRDSAGLAHAILSLLSDRPRATRLGHAGREWVRTEFNRDRFTRDLVHLYRGALRRDMNPSFIPPTNTESPKSAGAIKTDSILHVS